MTGKWKMRKKAGNKMKALFEKEVADSFNSNDSDTDVDVIFDENTRTEEINCNKADLSLDRSQENLETESNITTSTENINTNISNDNYNLQSINVQPEKIQRKFVTVELFNTFYDDYIQHKHYINDILENLKVNGNILSQFKEANDLEKNYQSKIKLLEENVEKLKTENSSLVEEAANYLKIIEDLSKGHSPTQNNEHHNQLQTGDSQWEHQQYNKNNSNIRKQQSKQIHNHHHQHKLVLETQVMLIWLKKERTLLFLVTV